MAHNAKQIYQNLCNIYGKSLNEIIDNNYSADSQCSQFDENKVGMAMIANIKEVIKDAEYITEGYIEK